MIYRSGTGICMKMNNWSENYVKDFRISPSCLTTLICPNSKATSRMTSLFYPELVRSIFIRGHQLPLIWTSFTPKGPTYEPDLEKEQMKVWLDNDLSWQSCHTGQPFRRSIKFDDVLFNTMQITSMHIIVYDERLMNYDHRHKMPTYSGE